MRRKIEVAPEVLIKIRKNLPLGGQLEIAKKLGISSSYVHRVLGGYPICNSALCCSILMAAAELYKEGPNSGYLAGTRNKMRHYVKGSGVYVIQSLQFPNRCYVGSSKNLTNRESTHFASLRRGENGNPRLQAHVNQYGIADLKFIVLEYCDESQLGARERYWLDTLCAPFNINTTTNRTVKELSN